MAFEDLLIYAIEILPFLGIAAAILYAGHLSYQTDQLRKSSAEIVARPDPLLELSRLNGQVVEQLAAARTTLDQARETVQRGVRG